MSNAAQHTNTPWRASHGTGPVMQGYSQSSCVAGTGEHALKLIAGCFNDIGGDEVAAANAAFIVRAVNSHDALVAALRELGEFASRARGTYASTKEWTDLPSGSCETIRVPVALLNRIRDAALAAAES